jgi:hypothetical protein
MICWRETRWFAKRAALFLARHLRGLKHDLIDIAPRPILTWLDRLHERVMSGVVVPSGVLIFRGIAAPDVAAGQTHSQMNPFVARLDAFFAAMSARLDVPRLIKMCTRCHEFDLLSHVLFVPIWESTLSEISMYERHCHSSLADSRCTSLHGPVPYIAGCKYSGHTSLQIERVAF